MKIKEYNQMMAYLTRPGVPRKEVAASKPKRDVLDYVNQVQHNYGDAELSEKNKKINDENKLGMKQLEKYAVQPDSRGAWKKFVSDNEKAEAESKALMQTAIEKSNTKVKGYPKEKPYYMNNPVNGKLENVNAKGFDWDKQKKHTEYVLDKLEDDRDFNDKRGQRFINKTLKPVEQNEDPRGVAFNPTTQLFTNKDRTVAFKTYDEADTWNKAINIKTKPKPLPTQATPEQVGALATRMERNRQMTGSDGRYDKAIIKKKKVFTPSQPMKIDLSTYTPLPVITRSPEEIAAEQNFQKLVRESEDKKNRLVGLETLLGRKA